MQDQENTQEKQHQTQQEIVAKLTKLYCQQDSIGEEIKEIKKEAKAVGYKPALLAKVAKAMANAKTSELLQQSEELQSIIEEVRS